MVYYHNFCYNIIIRELRGRLSAAAFLYIKSSWLSNFDLLLVQMTHMIPIIEIGEEKNAILFLPACLLLTFDSSVSIGRAFFMVR